MSATERIGRYQILEELGRGAMGVVYRASDPAIGRTIAVKTIRLASTSIPDREQHVERLRREAQSAGRLSHPGIVTVYDFVESDDAAYVCMELIEGESLDRLLAERRHLTRDSVLSILRQAADALDYAHSRGVVHRDIKPANILLQNKSSVKITDFGIAKILTEEGTLAGPMFGTPNYMSPEQVQSKPIGGRSDQFSLAVVAYEMMTGDKPFDGHSVASIVYKVCNEPAPPAHAVNPTLPPQVNGVFNRALAKDPAMRFPNVREFVGALERALSAEPAWAPQIRGQASASPTIAIPPSPLPVREERTHAGLIAMLVGIGAFVAVGAIFWAASLARAPQVPPAKQAVVAPAPVSPPPTAEVLKPSPSQDPTAAPPVAEPPSDRAAEPAEEAPPETPPATSSPAAEPKLQKASLAHDFTVDSTPSGATVQIDNIPSFTCVTPCRITLAAGRHTLKFNHDQYRPAIYSVDVPDRLRLAAALIKKTGTLMVKSNPPGATVFVDGSEWPSRTPVILTLSVGSHKLRITKEGFRDEENEVDVRDGAISTLEVNWKDQTEP